MRAASVAIAWGTCAASEIAKTIGSVATSMGNYLDAHPETNQALTTIAQQQAGPQSLGAIKAYFDANPQAAKDMQQLQQPLVSLSTRCKLPVSLPQLMGLMQAAQQQGGACPAVCRRAAVGADRWRSRARRPAGGASPVSAVTQGTGPLPGPATTPAR